MQELKPCPFCGHNAKMTTIENRRPRTVGLTGFFIKCSVCRATTGVEFVKEDAIEAWNRRAES